MEAQKPAVQTQQQTQKYIIIEKIAQGSYGSVFKAKVRTTNDIVAIKVFKNIAKQGIPVSAMRQIQIMNILNTISSERVLRMIQARQRKGQMMIVTEWMDKTLSQLIHSGQPFHPKFILREILKSLQVFHSNFILHRDIKPSNVMISRKADSTNNFIVKIVDYGMAKQDDFDNDQRTNQVGSFYYRAPELLLGTNKYTYSIDMWSIGCLFFQLLTRTILFKSTPGNQLAQFGQIVKALGIPDQEKTPFMFKIASKVIENIKISNQIHCSSQEYFSNRLQKIGVEDRQEAIDLLARLVSMEPVTRISLSQALLHPYLAHSNQQ